MGVGSIPIVAILAVLLIYQIYEKVNGTALCRAKSPHPPAVRPRLGAGVLADGTTAEGK
jgi:hypothetical protein